MLNHYDLLTYTRPFWTGDTVYHESLLPLAGKNGKAVPLPLLFKADAVLSVCDSSLSVVYEKDADWSYADGMLRIPEHSKIGVMPDSEYYPAEKADDFTLARAGGGWIRLFDRDWLHKRQIAVTYRHGERWTGTVPVYKGERLPGTIAKLENREKLDILFFGDSITTGANSSGVYGAPPHAPSWCDMLAERLRRHYRHGGITTQNTAVGGVQSAFGVEHAVGLAADRHPDLVFLAFGMNDGAGIDLCDVNPDQFAENLKAIVDIVRSQNPGCEFVLVSGMLPNPEFEGFFKWQRDYRAAMLPLEGRGIAVSDVTGVHSELLRRKRFCDMSGNNVNHPNDFLARVYAQTHLALLIKDYGAE